MLASQESIATRRKCPPNAGSESRHQRRKVNDVLFAGFRCRIAEVASEYVAYRDVTLFGDGGLARFLFVRAHLAPDGGGDITQMENPRDASLGEVTPQGPTPLAHHSARFLRFDRRSRARL